MYYWRIVTENGCIVNRLAAGVEPNLKSLVLPVELLYVLLEICLLETESSILCYYLTSSFVLILNKKAEIKLNFS